MKWLLGLLLLVGIAQAKEPVDVQIIFATDASGSVDMFRYQVQRDGLLSSLQNEEVKRRLGAGALGRVGLAYMEWSGEIQQYVRGQWALIRKERMNEDLRKFREEIMDSTRYMKLPPPDLPGMDVGGESGGATNIGAALRFIRRELLPASPFQAERTVIDISGDGRSNEGGDPDAERDLLIADGDVTINGIPLIDGEPDLAEYYESHVIGGPRAFVLPVREIYEYRSSIQRKLIFEIADALTLDPHG